ncbi:ATP-binding protein [Urechidicola sp. KH5]
MINKRLLIKKLLTHTDENSFYDKKLRLDLSSKVGKAKFVKHICALSNSNPENNSYIIVGIEDRTNKIVGVDFYDDSRIQNLVNAYLVNPPKVNYENIGFPKLQKHKVIGLVTIFPSAKVTTFKKNAWKYPRHSVFIRRGSNSMPVNQRFELAHTNKEIVESLEKSASNNIELTLDGVFDFFRNHDVEFDPQYKVFKEQFVLCWAGSKKNVGDKTFYSRVDIELINEQVRIFYSALDEVKITYNESSFIITEYVKLGINEQFEYFPLEKTVIHFKDNGKHGIVSELLFEPPAYDKKVLHHIYNSNNALLEKIKKEQPLNKTEIKDVKNFPTTYLICSLNGFVEAKDKLKEAKLFLRALEDKTAYIQYKDAIRILRKIKYQ